MVTIKVNVPDIIGELYREDRDLVVLETLRHIVFGEIGKKEDKLKKIDAQIRCFEEKYKQSLEDFSKNMPTENEMELHEAWVEWSYLAEVQKRLKNTIKKLESLHEKSSL